MIKKLTEQVIGCAMKVHRALGPGFLESVYQNALAHEFAKSKVRIQAQHRIPVYYEEVMVGDFYADFMIGDNLIIEIKAIQCLNKEHEVQIVNYLTGTGVDLGLLINFGSSSLQFKRKFRIYRNTGNRQDLQDVTGL